VFVAPEMDLQFAPALSQRSHWKAKLMGAVPDHEPVPATRVWPLVAVPEIAGGEVLAGAACGCAVPLSGRSSAVIATATSAATVR
jgi:hypothetical protein